MKRSDMLTVIHDALWDITGTSWSDERCDEILTKIEKAGMLPPAHNPHDYDEGKVSSILNFSCKWEPEDV